MEDETELGLPVWQGSKTLSRQRKRSFIRSIAKSCSSQASLQTSTLEKISGGSWSVAQQQICMDNWAKISAPLMKNYCKCWTSVIGKKTLLHSIEFNLDYWQNILFKNLTMWFLGLFFLSQLKCNGDKIYKLLSYFKWENCKCRSWDHRHIYW